MKYLSDYMEQAQTEMFEKYGVFFAFSAEQFQDGLKKVGANESNKVCEFGGGMYGLSKNAKAIVEALDNIRKDAIA